ncbi:hypothetical protein HID58_047462 [Brassica napus]|uniref:Uncharacterized protein n=1 Tax=Brassica napus TaxID=3708 RepID=A0ABQ8AZB7_BRANA|nr:hypothetical protein HID58_047462 [Brassica napus]
MGRLLGFVLGKKNWSFSTEAEKKKFLSTKQGDSLDETRRFLSGSVLGFQSIWGYFRLKLGF